MGEVLRALSFVRPLLQDVHRLWTYVNPTWCSVGLNIVCASVVPEFKEISFLLHFWATYISGYGGGIFSAILLMTPSRAPLSLLANNFAGLAWVAVWWLMNFCPGGLVSKIYQLWPITVLCKCCVHICRARLILNRVEAAVDLYPGVMMAPIVVGTISACGGKISLDTIKHAYGMTQAPHEISSPSYSWRSAFLAALFYYFTAFHQGPLRLLAKEEAAAVILTVFAAQSLLADFTGRPMDWTKPILTCMLTVLNIPVPESCKFKFTSESSQGAVGMDIAARKGSGASRLENGKTAPTSGKSSKWQENGHANGHVMPAAKLASQPKGQLGSGKGSNGRTEVKELKKIK